MKATLEEYVSTWYPFAAFGELDKVATGYQTPWLTKVLLNNAEMIQFQEKVLTYCSSIDAHKELKINSDLAPDLHLEKLPDDFAE